LKWIGFAEYGVLENPEEKMDLVQHHVSLATVDKFLKRALEVF